MCYNTFMQAQKNKTTGVLKIKSKRLSSKEAGVPSTNMINPKQWDIQKANRERWAKEDAEKAKK